MTIADTLCQGLLSLARLRACLSAASFSLLPQNGQSRARRRCARPGASAAGGATVHVRTLSSFTISISQVVLSRARQAGAAGGDARGAGANVLAGACGVCCA